MCCFCCSFALIYTPFKTTKWISIKRTRTFHYIALNLSVGERFAGKKIVELILGCQHYNQVFRKNKERKRERIVIDAGTSD